jgi:hypothetical protein
VAQISESEPPPIAARDILRQSWSPIVAHIFLFGGFAGLLALVREVQEVYDDPTPDLVGRTPVIMSVNRFFESIHVPLWTLAVLGLAVDLSVLWKLLRASRVTACDWWNWLVTAVVVATGGFIVDSVFRPLIFP